MGREENGVAPPQRRIRGKYRQPAWRRYEGQPVAVMVLELPVTDPRTLRRLANLYAAAWHIKRAVQRDARARVNAYWAARTQRKDKGPKAVRERLGLSREGLQRAAYQHLEDSGWLRHHLTKALAMHLTGEVWTATQRHLFGDATGKRAGRPKAGRWWDFTRIPGRARSHTTAAKWETFRLVGTLEGHVGAFRHPHLPQDVHPHTPADAAQLPPGQSVLLQPRRMATPTVPTGHVPTGNPTPSGRRKATWWDYDGPLAVVLTGIGGGDLVLPVRLPQGCGCWPRVLHFLADPDAWHKIDLVRRRKPSAPGGWAYEAHLMVLRPGYAAPGTVELRRQAAKLDRVGGVDGNVSHLEVVSLPATLDPAAGPVLSSEITLSETDKRRLLTQASKRRRRQRALDRSRRATNAQQYGLSKRQRKRAERRQVAGLPGKTVQMPRGPRAARNNGPPSRAYRTDRLSKSYQHHRDRLAANAARAAQANKARAMLLARHLIGIHGSNLTIEDCDIRAWFRLWGKRLSQTTPGLLLNALEKECAAAGGRLLRASTFTTAMSQHCLCGAAVRKYLRDREHICPACGLTGKRDLVSAALGIFVHLDDPNDPSTARVDYTSSRHAQLVFGSGLQEALRESTAAYLPLASAGGGRAAATRPQRRGPLLRETPDPKAGRPRMRPEPRQGSGHAGKSAFPPAAPVAYEPRGKSWAATT